jgi:uncharacterized protein
MKPGLKPLLSIGLMSILLVACAGTPRSQFYSLDNALPAPPIANSELSLALGPVDLPQYLDRPQLVSRDSGNRLRVDEFNRWGGAFDEEIQRVLVARLMNALGTQRVYQYPGGIVAETDYRIAVAIRNFDGRLGGPVTLDVGWSLFDDRSGKQLAARQVQYRDQAQGDGYSNYVAAMDRLLTRLSDDLAQAVRQAVGQP